MSSRPLTSTNYVDILLFVNSELKRVEESSEQTELLNCVGTNVRMASRVLTRYYDEIMDPSGVRVTQLAVLAAVAYHGPFTLKILAQALAMDRSTLTADLRLLAIQDFVTISPGEDRRTRVVTITEGGLGAIQAALPLWRRAQGYIDQRLGHARLDALLSEIREVVVLIQEA